MPAAVLAEIPGVPTQWLATTDPNATITPTPFLPADATAAAAISTPEPGEPTVEPTATPWYQAYEPIQGQMKILLLGSDQRNDPSYRTDVIMLVTINPLQGSVTVLSFPRDLYVSIPGYFNDRINTPMEYGGFSLMQATFQENFGITPDRYMLTNFAGFTGIIDTLGGVDVYADYNLTDKCSLPIAVDKYCSLGPGWVHLDGQTALWYVRSRYSTSDFDRERRAQEVIAAVFNKLMSLDAITRIPDLYNLFISSVETNVTLEDVISLAPVAPSLLLDSSKIRRYTIDYADIWPYSLPESGASVLLPNMDAIIPKLIQAVFTP